MSIPNRIATKIAHELKLDDEQRDIIAYGLFGFLQMLAGFILVTLCGWLLGIPLHALVVALSSGMLRQYSGGVHASKPSLCLIIGTIALVGIAYMVKLVTPLLGLVSLIALWVIILLWVFWTIYRRAPVDSPAKPIKTQAKKKRMRRNAFIVFTLCLLAVMVLAVCYYRGDNGRLLEFAGCIVGALAWQAFTLTMIGHKVLNSIDTFLNKHLLRERSSIE